MLFFFFFFEEGSFWVKSCIYTSALAFPCCQSHLGSVSDEGWFSGSSNVSCSFDSILFFWREWSFWVKSYIYTSTHSFPWWDSHSERSQVKDVPLVLQIFMFMVLFLCAWSFWVESWLYRSTHAFPWWESFWSVSDEGWRSDSSSVRVVLIIWSYFGVFEVFELSPGYTHQHTRSPG